MAQLEIIINVLVISASFEYLCYGSTAIINILHFQCGDRLYTSVCDVYGRQIMTSRPKVDFLTERAQVWASVADGGQH